MISIGSPLVWLFVFGSGYLAMVLYWARVASLQGEPGSNYVNHIASVAPFVTIVAIGAAGFVPIYVIGFADGIARFGFGYGAVMLGAVLVPLTGVFLFKRIWALAVKLGEPGQAGFLDTVYQNKTLMVLSAGLGLLYAVAFGGRVMAAFALLFHDLSLGVFDPLYSLAVIASIVASTAVIGGMRSVLFTGAIHGVLGVVCLVGLIGFTLYLSGGFEALSDGVEALQAKTVDGTTLFSVAGVIQFTLGDGHAAAAGSSWTAVMVMSTALAFLGLHASPVSYQFAVASRSNHVFGPGLTWVSGGLFGGLVIVAALILGAYGLVHGHTNLLLDVMSDLSQLSPWFSAALYFGLFSLAVTFVAGSFLAAGHLFVCDIYRRNFHQGLSDSTAATSIRIAVIVLVLAAVLLSLTSPVLVTQLSALCLPLGAQLLPALAGACYRIGITRQSVPVGAVVGFICVLLTEPFGLRVLDFVGLDVPWGASPWTIHSAGWGLFFNVGTVVGVSIITRFRDQGAHWTGLGDFLERKFPVAAFSRPVVSTAWSIALAWFFFAVGPGLIIGSTLFVRDFDEGVQNMLGLPSIVIWILISWATGVSMNWFFAYRMQLSTPISTQVSMGPAPVRKGHLDSDKLSKAVWILLSIAGVLVALSWAFGG